MSEWQPIETAPQDGSDVQVISSKWLAPVVAYFVSSKYLRDEYEDEDIMSVGWYPSHINLFDLPEVVLFPEFWMPLPKPPGQ
jgi:hypothetical protein